MSATATSELDSAPKISDTNSISVAWDDAFAALPTGKLDTQSAFRPEVQSAQALTAEHVAKGNLPQVDLTRVG